MSEPDVVDDQFAADEVAVWFDRYALQIGRYAARRVRRTLALDIVAETFRIALHRFVVFDPGRANERAWLYGIASNLIQKHWRTEQRRLRTEIRFIVGDRVLCEPLLRTGL